MENKYYTPESSELFLGYSCEILNRNIETKEDEWVTHIIKQLPNRLTIRTKYLDKQDIESLGWKFKGKSIDIWFEKEGTFDMGCFTTYKIIMHYGLEDHRMFIYADDQGTEYDLFKGEIKSINEFKYIQKLLGIK